MVSISFIHSRIHSFILSTNNFSAPSLYQVSFRDWEINSEEGVRNSGHHKAYILEAGADSDKWKHKVISNGGIMNEDPSNGFSFHLEENPKFPHDPSVLHKLTPSPSPLPLQLLSLLWSLSPTLLVSTLLKQTRHASSSGPWYWVFPLPGCSSPRFSLSCPPSLSGQVECHFINMAFSDHPLHKAVSTLSPS